MVNPKKDLASRKERANIIWLTPVFWMGPENFYEGKGKHNLAYPGLFAGS